MRIANRTFVVSGGSSGLGLATVKTLLEANAYVAALDISPLPSHTKSSRLLYVEADVTNIDQIQAAVEKVVAWSKSTGAHLGGVVNSAGIAAAELTVSRGQPHSTELWNRVLGVNLNGTFHLSRLVAQHLVTVPQEQGADGERGVIIMVSSTVAYEGQAGQIAYAAAKGAIQSMTLPMSRDMARYGVRVVSLAPGPFRTPMTGQFSRAWTDKLEKDAVLFPKRYGAPEEFSATVKWILECSYVNGETYKLTGGARVPANL